MDGHCSSPEPHFESPPQNTSTPARKACSDGGSGSEESIRDEEEEEHTEDDLDEFFKNAEGLSDQTFGDVDRSLSHSYHHTLNECSMSDPNFQNLSCSMLAEAEKSLQSWRQKSNEIAYQLGTDAQSERNSATDPNELVKILHNELLIAHQENKTLKIKNAELLEKKGKQEEFIKQASEVTLKCIPKIRSARDNIEMAGLSICSLEPNKTDCFPNTTADSFRLSSYFRQLDRNLNDSEILLENKSQEYTSHVPAEDQRVNNIKFDSLCQDLDAFKREWYGLKQITQQGLCDASKELKEFTFIVQNMVSRYENELSSSKHSRLNDQKHYQEMINNLKDDIKTMKMRNQELMKHKDQEIRELKSRLPETNEKDDNVAGGNATANAPEHNTAFDDSFSSCNSNLEETFTNLTRTKVEYLKLTPSEYVDDEVIDTIHIPDGIRHLLDDKDLKYKDLEKKFEANKRYLEDMTHEREIEREEFQQQSQEHLIQIEELKKDNAKFMEEKKQLVYQIEELTTRLQNAEENEMEIAQKCEKSDGELKAAVEKIFELREIVRDQEIRIDEMTQNVAQLEEQKQVLRDELEKQELLNKKEQPIYKEQDTYGTLPLDVTDEIHQQLQELARRIEYKVTEMDSVQMHTRPSSSCSGVASAVSTEDISCREVAGRTSRNLESCSYEHMGSAIFNEIHRLESHVENLIRYDDVFIKKLKDAELQNVGQKTKIEELENQIVSYQEKCSKQMLQIADLEGKVDALRFESSNQGLISSLQTRLGTASKQLDELRILLASKDKELTQVRAEFNVLRTKQLERKTEKKEASVQTYVQFEDTISYPDLTYEGVSPEKIRRMDTVNPLNASVISLSRTLGKESQAISFEQEASILESFHEPGRSGKGVSFAGGENCAGESSTGEGAIKEMDDSLLQLQQLLQEKDKQIQSLNQRLKEARKEKDCFEEKSLDPDKPVESRNTKCEQESIVLETDLNPNQTQSTGGKGVAQGRGPGSDGDSSTYEISYSHDYEIDGDLLKYLGTKLLYQGPMTENIGDQGQRRVLETDRQIEIATLNTHILQLKRALQDEKKKSEDLLKRLKLCEEDKAAMRSRSPMTRAPVQNIVSSVSLQQMQQKELARQIEDGRKLLKEKDKEIRNLKNKITDFETKLKDKGNHEQELATRLNNTMGILKRCEEHGRELSANNQEQVQEIRRLRLQLDRANVNRNIENCPQPPQVGSGNEYFENFMRAKSHRKALAWQKKYMSSVILGYKSILRQNGHGSEHPDLLQTQIPIAPGAVGYLDTQSPRTKFRIGVLTVIATLRMKYMVSRWCKKRPGESSPDSEYKTSRHSTRVDSSIIRPRKTALMHSKTNAHAPIDNNVNVHETRRGNLGDISEYLSRFASLENEISSSLSRNVRPSK